MKITEINLKEEGAKYYCKEGVENFIVQDGDLVGENSGLDISNFLDQLDVYIDQTISFVNQMKK